MNVWLTAAVWMALALAASIISIRIAERIRGSTSGSLVLHAPCSVLVVK